MKRSRNGEGFTLAEMLVTILIMVLVMSIAVPVFMRSRARTRRSDAVNAVRAAMAAARQQAVRRRTVVAIEFIIDAGNEGNQMVLVDKSTDLSDDADRRIGNPITLPEFIEFQAVAPDWTLENGWQGDPADETDTEPLVAGDLSWPHPDIAYNADGTAADGGGTTDILMVDTVEHLRIVLRVLPATGLVVEARHLQDPTQAEGPTNPRDEGWL